MMYSVGESWAVIAWTKTQAMRTALQEMVMMLAGMPSNECSLYSLRNGRVLHLSVGGGFPPVVMPRVRELPSRNIERTRVKGFGGDIRIVPRNYSYGN